MPKTQVNPIAPPSPADIEAGLKDYNSKVQQSFAELFFAAHDHSIRTEAPPDEDGAVGDILLVQVETERYLVAKYSDGWYRTSAITKLN